MDSLRRHRSVTWHVTRPSSIQQEKMWGGACNMRSSQASWTLEAHNFSFCCYAWWLRHLTPPAAQTTAPSRDRVLGSPRKVSKATGAEFISWYQCQLHCPPPTAAGHSMQLASSLGPFPNIHRWMACWPLIEKLGIVILLYWGQGFASSLWTESHTHSELSMGANSTMISTQQRHPFYRFV